MTVWKLYFGGCFLVAFGGVMGDSNMVIAAMVLGVMAWASEK